MGSGVPKRGGVGASTVPVRMVLPPDGQVTWRLHRFTQVSCPHTPAVPPPPQVSGLVQPPQSSEWPQPSPMVPQYLPVACWQVMAVQGPAGVQTLAVQSWPVGQAPQESVLPQPSPMVPQ